MRMLSRDNELFHRRFREAADFCVAAGLRYECYKLACKKERSKWQTERLEDLLHCPACRETWFVVMLRCDCRDNEIEKMLITAGV
jgi:hypothetical protein